MPVRIFATENALPGSGETKMYLKGFGLKSLIDLHLNDRPAHTALVDALGIDRKNWIVKIFIDYLSGILPNNF